MRKHLSEKKYSDYTGIEKEYGKIRSGSVVRHTDESQKILDYIRNELPKEAQYLGVKWRHYRKDKSYIRFYLSQEINPEAKAAEDSAAYLKNDKKSRAMKAWQDYKEDVFKIAIDVFGTDEEIEKVYRVGFENLDKVDPNNGYRKNFSTERKYEIVNEFLRTHPKYAAESERLKNIWLDEVLKDKNNKAYKGSVPFEIKRGDPTAKDGNADILDLVVELNKTANQDAIYIIYLDGGHDYTQWAGTTLEELKADFDEALLEVADVLDKF